MGEPVSSTTLTPEAAGNLVRFTRPNTREVLIRVTNSDGSAFVNLDTINFAMRMTLNS